MDYTWIIQNYKFSMLLLFKCEKIKKTSRWFPQKVCETGVFSISIQKKNNSFNHEF